MASRRLPVAMEPAIMPASWAEERDDAFRVSNVVVAVASVAVGETTARDEVVLDEEDSDVVRFPVAADAVVVENGEEVVDLDDDGDDKDVTSAPINESIPCIPLPPDPEAEAEAITTLAFAYLGIAMVYGLPK